MKIEINLLGWADSLTKYKKLEFALQIAMYEVFNDCDWIFEINTIGTYVNAPFNIHVIATRRSGAKYHKGVLISYSIQQHKFDFIVSSYTLENIYKEAKKVLSELKNENTKNNKL